MPVDFIEEVEPTSIDFVEESPAPTLRGPSEPSIRSTLTGGPPVQTMPFTEAIQEPVETAGRMIGSTEPAIPFTKLIPSPETPTTLAERGLAMAIPGGAVASALYGPEVPVAGIRSLARGVLSVPEFLTSPLGISTAGVASLGKVAQTLVSLGFSVDMAKSLYQQGAANIKNWGSMTPEQRVDALVSMAQTAGFAGAAGVHGAKGAVELLPKRPVEPAAVPPVIPPPIPKTPPPLPRLAETPDVETALRQPEGAEALTEIDKEIARSKQLSPPAPGSKPTELPAETPVKETPEVAGGEIDKLKNLRSEIESELEYYEPAITAEEAQRVGHPELEGQKPWSDEARAGLLRQERADINQKIYQIEHPQPTQPKAEYAVEKRIEQESVQPERERTDALRPTTTPSPSDSLRAATEGKAQKEAPEVLLKPEGRNWDLFNENLNDALDAFSPARTTGRVDYDMRDVAERFVSYAKKDKSGKPLDKLVKDFADFDEASDSQIRKLRASVKNVLKEEQPTQPPSKPAEGGGGVPAKDIPTLQSVTDIGKFWDVSMKWKGKTQRYRITKEEASTAKDAAIVAVQREVVGEMAPERLWELIESQANYKTSAQPSPLSLLEMGRSYPYLNTIVQTIKLSADGKKVKVRDLKSGTGATEWVPVNKLNTARFLADAALKESTKQPTTPPTAGGEGKPIDKAKEKIDEVASTEGKRAAKEIKSELVQRLEDAIQKAPSVLDERPKGVPDKITIEIPDDGTFTVFNSKEVIQRLLNRASRIETTPYKPEPQKPKRHLNPMAEAKDRILAEKRDAAENLRAIKDVHGETTRGYRAAQEMGIKAPKEWLKTPDEPTKPPPEVGEKPIGMGGAVPEEFQRAGGSPAATKFRMMDKARVARGLEPLLKPESIKDQAVLDRAMAEYDNNPAGAEKLADSLIENPRPIQDWENDYLLLRWIDTRDQFYKSAKEAQIADADGRLADLAAANGRTAEWSAAMTKLEKALRVGGSETGRALRARRVLIAEDFTLAGLETQRRAQLQSVGVSGAELERQMAEGRAELEKMASEYKATADSLKIDLENRNQRISRLEAQLELNRIKAEAAKQPYDKRVLDYAESIVKRMETAADAASTRLKERLSRMSAGVDPLILSDAAIVGAAKIARLGLNLAKFTDVMVAEYSEKMRPFMAEIWDASNKLLEANLKPENKKVKTAIKRNATITERKVDAETKIRTKIQEGKRNELTPVLRRYERILVEQGMDKLDPIVDEVHKFVQQIDPTMTRDMTMDALSGYGDFKPLSKNTIDVVVRDLHQQGQLVAKLRDMASGVSPSRSGFERQPPSDIARWLTKQVEEAKKKGGYKVTDPATQLRTAMDAVHKRFQDQIADLEHQISTRQKIVRDKTALVYDEKANQLKARRDELKEIFDEVFPKEPLTDAQRLERWNRQIDRRIADYEERIINRDFSKREKRPPPPLGPNELAKMDRLLQLKEGFNDLLLHDRYKNMKLHQKAWVAAKESLNIPRNVMASADLSAVLRQGGILAGSHPIIAAKGIVPMLKGFASERLAGISDQEILNRPNAKTGRYAQAKLYMAPLRSTTLSAMEEQIMSRFVHSKLFKWTGVRASNRAFITFLNRIRADSFDLMVENLERKGTPLTDAELKAIGNYINIATGRGDMGRFAAGSEALATAFFAPRLVTSRFQFLAGQPFMRGTAQTRTLIAKEYARSLAALSVVLTLGSLAGATVETDPRSSDFGKMRFGNVRLDPMAGLSQTAVLLSRIFSGKQKQMSGKLVPLRGPEVKYGMGNTADVLFRFLRAKFSPVVGTALNVASGENVVGEPVTAVNEIKNLLTPLSFQEVLNVMKEQGIASGTAMTILSLFGMGLQYFEPKSKASNAALIP